MGEKQVTTMVLKVDLQCHRCYKKIKKVLCKIPQIQDQVYNEKENTVTIKVVCCSPEKIKEKIICKAGETLKSIEIKPPKKPKEPETPKAPATPKSEPERPKDPEAANEPVGAPAPPKSEPERPKDPVEVIEPVGVPKRLEDPVKFDEPVKLKGPKKPKPDPTPPAPVPGPCVERYAPPVYPYRVCCTVCFEGRPGGPCFYGCVPPRPPPCCQYDGCYGRSVYDSYCGSRAYHTSRCDYFSEENTGACSIM